VAGSFIAVVNATASVVIYSRIDAILKVMKWLLRFST
jgi:hypothetical protein